jgi:hypothetical protein
MTRTSAPGNEEGIVLLDALFCLFVAALILLLISGAVHNTLHHSSRIFSNSISIIDERNSKVGETYEE